MTLMFHLQVNEWLVLVSRITKNIFSGNVPTEISEREVSERYSTGHDQWIGSFEKLDLLHLLILYY